MCSYYVVMLKKILCPFDFSPCSLNAGEYAAKLAQATGSSLLFVNVQKERSFSFIPALAEVGSGATAPASVVAQKLDEMCADVRRTFRIAVDYEVAFTNATAVSVLTSSHLADTLIVMCTNGIDETYQSLFGSNTYRLIKRTKCPMLVVPGNCGYGSITKVVVAWDYSRKILSALAQLEKIFEASPPEYLLTHVEESGQRGTHDLETLRSIRSDIIAMSPDFARRVRFNEVRGELASAELNRCMETSGAQVMTLVFHNRSFLSGLFMKNITRELVENASYPLLIVQE